MGKRKQSRNAREDKTKASDGSKMLSRNRRAPSPESSGTSDIAEQTTVALDERTSSAEELAILVMGLTGSGKSTFISRLTDEAVEIGHSLESCTTEVDGYTIQTGASHRMTLIDTPGFDDTQQSDIEILQKIASALHTMYVRHDFRLGGLIYLHRITDQRVSGSSLKSLRIFEQICGEENFKYVVLVTTMWNLLGSEDDQKKGGEKEETLKSTPEFFGRMIAGGARLMRDDGTSPSAHKIIDQITKQRYNVVTALQREMADEENELRSTSVGQFLEGELEQVRKRYEIERDELEEALRDAIEEDDENLRSAISEQKRDYEERIKRAAIEQSKFSVRFKDLLQDQIARYAVQVKEAEKLKSELEGTRLQLEDTEDQLYRAEQELAHIRRSQAKDERAVEERRKCEQRRARLADQVEQRKAVRKAKETMLRKTKRTMRFLMAISEPIDPDHDLTISAIDMFKPLWPRPFTTTTASLYRDPREKGMIRRKTRSDKEYAQHQPERVRRAETGPHLSVRAVPSSQRQAETSTVVYAPLPPATSARSLIPTIPNAAEPLSSASYSVPLVTAPMGPPRRIPEEPQLQYRRFDPNFHAG